MAVLRQTLSRWAGQPPPARWRRLPGLLFILFIGALLAYGGGFAASMLANFDVLDLVVTTRDDSFYYFQIAWHMAQGRFSTFDGGITQTNGYHPLWLFLITPFYWLLDKESALYAIRALEIMLIAGGVAVIAGAARLCRLPWLLLFAALPLLYRKKMLFFGMEAAAALFMLALLFVGLALFARNPARWKWALAAICFALPWARLEYIAISLAVAGVLCLFEFPQGRRAAGGGGWRAGLRSFHALAPLLGAGAGILVYFAYNGLVFGGLVPVSGATKAVWSQFRWERDGGYDFGESLRSALQVPVFDGELLAALSICLGLLPLWWLARRAGGGDGEGRDRLLFAFMLGGFGLAVGHLAMFGRTVLSIHPELQGGSQWYFVPAYLLMALLAPLYGYAALGLVRGVIQPRWPRAAKPLQAAVILAAAGLLLLQTDFRYPREAINPPSTKPDPFLIRYAGSLTANRGLPDGSVIGSWAAGAIGYFSRFPVVNLDGLVNSYDFLRVTQEEAYGEYVDAYAFRDGRGLGAVHGLSSGSSGAGAAPPSGAAPEGGGLPRILREFGITHLATSGAPGAWDGLIFESGWHRPDGSLRAHFRLRPAAPEATPDAAVAFAERMQAAAGPAGGGGGWLTVDGRLTQAFGADCGHDELLVWSYADGAGGAAAQFPATTTYHSSAGWCTVSLTRPHDTWPPVRVETMAVGEYLGGLGRPAAVPETRAPFAVYVLRGPPGMAPQLLYAKASCAEEDTENPFFLHLYPEREEDLPAGRRSHGYANADFRFQQTGGRFGGWCLAAAPLYQDYPLSRVRTGQWLPEENRRLWEAEFPLVP